MTAARLFGMAFSEKQITELDSLKEIFSKGRELVSILKENDRMYILYFSFSLVTFYILVVNIYFTLYQMTYRL